VYVYRNTSAEILYVGKAKSLRSRVRSYFQRAAQHGPRTSQLVGEIADFEYIVVDTEMEALILEANLIKREHPPFNVVLRDDKNFPYLKLSLADPFPRVSLVRAARLDKNAYFGPFIPSSVAVVPEADPAILPGRDLQRSLRRQAASLSLLPPRPVPAPCAGKTTREEYGRPSPTRSCSWRGAIASSRPR
jgi:excinuclease ABC subunit C